MSVFALYAVVREAVASSAIEHPAGHGCDTCKAAAGDVEALRRLWLALTREENG